MNSNQHYTVGQINLPTQTTAYIPTVFTVPPELKVGDFWYVKPQGELELIVFKILDATEKTVYILNPSTSRMRRYKKTDIEFVERVKR